MVQNNIQITLLHNGKSEKVKTEKVMRLSTSVEVSSIWNNP